MIKFKKIIYFTLIAFSYTSFAQFSEPYRPSKAVLVSGDTLLGMGKIKNKSYKYKPHLKAKPKQIDFSKIDFVQIRHSKDNIKTYKFLLLEGKEKYRTVRPSISGSRVELFFNSYNLSSTGAGGISVNQTITKYYIRKTGEEKIKYLGKYDLFGKMRENVIKYFHDCPDLIEKIKNKTFRMRDGLEDVITFYNENCN
ncbi:hypothetical protein OD91_1097 [Lutibacter sp. Hel_I_33_5]|uniref:hypothetical protein n=1 Tax=Lutibacter sp. Hel_I_33_5 TaxID=1566289 RepID=UPI0011A5EA7F|nr:hypothetical protein [Lutibacter sp. Hel_I_33_5]TVZ55828.1 hypothetical protein OD91_1097 [Lutibacter sp. Hel_I_33_5]